jgi:hypothetical protein
MTMNTIKIAFQELVGMFIDDGALALFTLGLVFLVGVSVRYGHLNGLVGGVVLLIGCIVILSESVWRAARDSDKGR